MKKKLSIFLIIAALLVTLLSTQRREKVFEKQNLSKKTEDKIHFLNVGAGDCILLESNGKFALIDSGEDAKSIRFLFTNKKGYGDFVIDYIKELATNEIGKVDLEFIIGTHSHTDHLGNMDAIILDENINVKQLILKKYDPTYIRKKERFWSNEKQYNNVVKAMRKELGLYWNQKVSFMPTDESFTFGDFTIKNYNTEAYSGTKTIGENENSIVTVLEIRGKRICLAADINNYKNKDGLGKEDILADQIGKVDVLKLGHHGYSYSNSENFLETLNPEIAIVTNKLSKVVEKTTSKLDELNTVLFSSNVEDGIALEILEDEMTINEIKNKD